MLQVSSIVVLLYEARGSEYENVYDAWMQQRARRSKECLFWVDKVASLHLNSFDNDRPYVTLAAILTHT